MGNFLVYERVLLSVVERYLGTLVTLSGHFFNLAGSPSIEASIGPLLNFYGRDFYGRQQSRKGSKLNGIDTLATVVTGIFSKRCGGLSTLEGYLRHLDQFSICKTLLKTYVPYCSQVILACRKFSRIRGKS